VQLHIARLCLDCDEIYDQQTCPICSSESFAYISRWIPAPERRARPRAAATESRETVDTYRQLLDTDGSRSGANRWLKRGVLGLAAVGIAGWAWRRKPSSLP
jgi:predicted  nucleic acid-binding Zn-ribbon protein